MDLVGLDVAHAVMKSMYQQYFEEPKYRPSFIAEPRVAAGLHGRKTKRGWYEYAPDLQMPPEAPAPKTRPAAVWAVPELKELLLDLGAKLELKPAPDAVCFVAPLGLDATAAALEQGLDPARTVAVDPLFGFSKRRTLMVKPVAAAPCPAGRIAFDTGELNVGCIHLRRTAQPDRPPRGQARAAAPR